MDLNSTRYGSIFLHSIDTIEIPSPKLHTGISQKKSGDVLYITYLRS